MKRSFLLSIFTFLLFLIPTSLSAAEFSDINDHWAKSYLQNAADLGLVNGYPDGRFLPDHKISRAEFVTILAQDSGDAITEDTIRAEEFPDVAKDHWARLFILWGREHNILNGYDDGSFRPDNNISRQEMASLLFRYITHYRNSEIIENTPKTTFADDDKIGNWAKDGVYAMQRSGIISGRGNHIFDPLTGTTRAET
ncbi:MAG: S-layer homology domain-containing protein, partial [Firmicutes bacterium]|nr:S-layer homology domain-containing protein [Bacillota bacterium]